MQSLRIFSLTKKKGFSLSERRMHYANICVRDVEEQMVRESYENSVLKPPGVAVLQAEQSREHTWCAERHEWSKIPSGVNLAVDCVLPIQQQGLQGLQPEHQKIDPCGVYRYGPRFSGRVWKLFST